MRDTAAAGTTAVPATQEERAWRRGDERPTLFTAIAQVEVASPHPHSQQWKTLAPGLAHMVLVDICGLSILNFPFLDQVMEIPLGKTFTKAENPKGSKVTLMSDKGSHPLVKQDKSNCNMFPKTATVALKL